MFAKYIFHVQELDAVVKVGDVVAQAVIDTQQIQVGPEPSEEFPNRGF